MSDPQTAPFRQRHNSYSHHTAIRSLPKHHHSTPFLGIFFGFYPARKASRLNPIEALRYE